MAAVSLIVPIYNVEKYLENVCNQLKNKYLMIMK